MRKLLYISLGYPLSAITEQSFIEPELKYLSNKFDSVIFLPLKLYKGGELDNVILPKNVTVNSRLAESKILEPSRIDLLTNLFRASFLKIALKEFKKLHNKVQFNSLLATYREIRTLYNWIEKEYFPTDDELTIYTFWFNSEATVASKLSKKYGVKSISRAHGYDLYDERVTFRSHYLREKTLNHISGVYPCSLTGEKYLQHQYQKYCAKISCSYLGSVKIFDGLCMPNTDSSKITFFSCSRIVSIKRVPMILSFLGALAKEYAEKQIEWLHIGDGEEKDAVETSINKGLPKNMAIKLLGAKNNIDVHKFFINNKIDWFISMSESEGLPVSMCEALSYGVPIIATNVGGVSEIVTSEVGVLLSETPTQDEFLNKIKPFLLDEKRNHILRTSAVLRWKNLFNADELRKNFVNQVL